MSSRKRPPPNPLDPDSDSDSSASTPHTTKKRPPHPKPAQAPPPPPPAAAAPADQDDEDDYMNMVIPEPQAPETLTQRKKRQQLEAETRGRPKSKAELAALEKANREAALSQSLLTTQSTSKGLRMMQKMGFTPGSALGAPSSSGTGTLEPLSVTPKEGRRGIGHSEPKTAPPPTTTTTTTAPAEQLSPEDYRTRVAESQEARRRDAQLTAAMKVAEGLSGGGGGDAAAEGAERTVPLRGVNVLWRGMVKAREARERDRRARYEVLQTLDQPKLPGYDRVCELDAEDKVALGLAAPALRRLAGERFVEEVEDEEGEEVDAELEAFEALEVAERLRRVCGYLRSEYWYCFWCKYRYEDEGMEGCPGVEEDVHG